MSVIIRAARPEEAAALTELALRSKAHWGYDAAFMEACRDDLTLTPELIAQTFVIADDETITGLYTLDLAHGADSADLLNLFVAPEAIGQGYGGRLWHHAADRARAAGKRWLYVESDPHAQAFYERMGAVQVGTVLSGCIAGRTLPLLRCEL